MGYANEDTCKTKAAEGSIYSFALQGMQRSCVVLFAIPGCLRRTATFGDKIFRLLPPESCATGKRVVRNLIRICVLFFVQPRRWRIAVGAPTRHARQGNGSHHSQNLSSRRGRPSR